MTIRVLVADDQSMVRAGFRMLLAGEEDIEVVAEASNGRFRHALGPCIDKPAGGVSVTIGTQVQSLRPGALRIDELRQKVTMKVLKLIHSSTWSWSAVLADTPTAAAC